MLCIMWIAATLCQDPYHSKQTDYYKSPTVNKIPNFNALRYVDSCHTVPISLPQYADGLL